MSSSSRSSVSKNSRQWHQRSGSLDTAPAYTPQSLIKHHSLPVAAYFQSPEVPTGLDASQPLLLYKTYTSKKVRAASLQISRDSGLLAVGPTLVIPESYSGWFSVVSSKGRSAPYFSTIDEVAKSQPLFFLTRYEIIAYVKEIDPEECNRVTYRRITVKGGHVLKLLGIFEDLNKRKLSGETGTGKNKFIQCLNHRNEAIFVPFCVSGKFYETAQRGSTNLNNVFLISQIFSTFQLPLNVRLVCGYMTRVPDAFTGILRLEKIEKETVILACTMTSEAKATLLEMDIASNFLLRPIVDPLYTKTPIFLKSVSYCSEEAESWQRQIKVIHHITEDETSSLLRHSTNSTTMSTSSVGSNLSFLGDFDKMRGKERERSKTRLELSKNFIRRDKSKENNKLSLEKNKEFRGNEDHRSRPKNKESKFKLKVKDKLQDLTSNRQYVVNGEFISIRVDDKLSGKSGYDNRKLSKQNTYIFQNEKIVKQTDKKTSEVKETPVRSFESQEYATVIDDISRIRNEPNYEHPDIHFAEHNDSYYAEICERKMTVSESKIKVAHTVKIRS